ncbi:uncharacterized protein RJT21DRAFT_117701 [Scheffersomyces amazonensis]|uniref:uncharacterized protein n=1 Tax=Scheffersomyces amazonensis TaxID=1078765 RepID=UPI00315DEE44
MAKDDGERTPGNSNTKVSFKDDEETDSRPHSIVSGFDDDVATISHEGEDAQLEAQEESTEEPAEEVTEEPVKETIDEPIEQGKPSEKEADEVDASSKEVEETKLEDNKLLADTTPRDEDVKVKELAENDVVEHEAPAIERIESPVPSIPARPSKRPIKKTHSASEDDVKSSEGESPVIPSRPSKSVSEEAKISPVIPSRPAKISPTNTEKPKAPPPKPKKLSSRIAAFQQMFNQESNIEPPLPKSTSEKISGDKPPVGGLKKLSEDKMKFAKSLQGMVGMGIPLPGMANPLLQKRLERQQQEEEEQDEEDDKQEHGDEDKKSDTASVPKSAARPRGPRGKKLPKSLKEPTNIEQEPRFKLATYDLWEVSFKKSVAEESIPDVVEEEDKENEKKEKEEEKDKEEDKENEEDKEEKEKEIPLDTSERSSVPPRVRYPHPPIEFEHLPEVDDYYVTEDKVVEAQNDQPKDVVAAEDDDFNFVAPTEQSQSEQQEEEANVETATEENDNIKPETVEEDKQEEEKA